MSPEEIRKKVRCSSCQQPINDRINLVELQRKAKWEYPSAGNVLTGETGKAVAICCDACIDEKCLPVEAVELRGEEVVYHPIMSLERCKQP
jgi:hypothetical protein